MLLVLKKIISIFLIIGVGYILKKKDIVDEKGNQTITAILMKVICPCMIFSSIAGEELSDDTFSITLWSMALSIGMSFILMLVGFLINRYVLRIQNREHLAVYCFCFPIGNFGFFGFPISLAVFGAGVLYIFVLENMMMPFYLYFYGIVFMHMLGNGGKVDSRKLKGLIKNECLISSVLGMLFLFSGWKVPEFIFSSVEMIGNATTPIAMIIIGVMLADCNVKDYLKDFKFILAAVLRMITVPLIGFLAVNWLPVDVTVKIGFVFSFSFPTAFMAAPMVMQEGYDSDRAAAMIAFTTLLSIIIIPLSASVLTQMYL